VYICITELYNNCGSVGLVKDNKEMSSLPRTLLTMCRGLTVFAAFLPAGPLGPTARFDPWYLTHIKLDGDANQVRCFRDRVIGLCISSYSKHQLRKAVTLSTPRRGHTLLNSLTWHVPNSSLYGTMASHHRPDCPEDFEISIICALPLGYEQFKALRGYSDRVVFGQLVYSTI
jgi:hypothetical protein